MEIFKLILELLKQLFEARNRSRRTEAQLQNLVQLYDAISLLSSVKDISRVAIYKIENSGGLIDPKVPLYASVLHEDYSSPLTSLKMMFSKLPIDQSFIRLIVKVIQEGSHKCITETMEDGLLRDIYIKTNIKGAKMYYLGSSPRAIYMMAVSSVIADNFESNMDYKVNCIQAIYKVKKALWNAKN